MPRCDARVDKDPNKFFICLPQYIETFRQCAEAIDLTGEKMCLVQTLQKTFHLF